MAPAPIPTVPSCSYDIVVHMYDLRVIDTWYSLPGIFYVMDRPVQFLQSVFG